MINNREDEDSSAYPLYPWADDITNKEKKLGDLSIDRNVEITEYSNEINDCHDIEFNPDSRRDMLDVPIAELYDKDDIIGEKDQVNNYYRIGGKNHNNIEWANKD